MMKKMKGFVLTETIVVITVLCVIMITLYAAYSSVLIKVNKKSLYDNTEYIYKTNIIRDYLEDTLNRDDYETNYYVVCNTMSNPCYGESSTTYLEKLLRELKVKAIYITNWNVDEISDADLAQFEATTQAYIKTLDYMSTTTTAYRIVVMYEDENSGSKRDVYQYATLRFGDRG